MKKTLVAILLFCVGGLYAQFYGPIPAINTGYGSDSLNVSVQNIPNDNFSNKDISIFYPSDDTTPNPTIFYSHGFGGNDTINQTHLLRHIASKGYTVVFVPYATVLVTIEDRYNTLYNGFIKAAEELPNLIDTTRTGFYGHSFGGGATPSIAYKLFTQRNWGTNGKFMYCSAPWYTYDLSPFELSNFPTDCNLLTVLYENDDINDHRMGIDIFENISINDNNKDCIKVLPDTISGYHYQASHSLPSQSSNSFDAYDSYVTFRLMDALADFTFNGNINGENVALGNGSTEQIDMGGVLIPLVVDDNPLPSQDESYYMFPCSDTGNPRQSYCNQVTAVTSLEKENFTVYPNPVSDALLVKTSEQINSITIFNLVGQLITQNLGTNTIDIASLDAGIYIVLIESEENIITQKVVKN